MLKTGHLLDDKYEVIKVLGQGGMGTVYLCKNTRLGKLWAIKEVRKEEKSDIDFLAEPNILKNLNHIGIPRIVDIFYEEDKIYIVEDYIEGHTLENVVKDSCLLPETKIYKYALELCDIIAYIHSFNPPIIYRDLKPSNIIITPNDRVVLIDFGISRTYKENKSSDTISMGSRGYAAPEQYGLSQSGKQTDIYGLGAVMYFMALGKPPLSLMEPFKDENCANIVPTLKKIIQKCMQVDVKERYSVVEELMLDIKSCMNTNNYEKTKVLNTDYEKTKVLKSKPSFIRTVIMATIVVFTILTVMFLFNSNKNASIAENSNNNASDSAVDVKENLTKDTSTDEGIVKDSDITENTEENKDKKDKKDKGKHRGKSSDKSKDDDKKLEK